MPRTEELRINVTGQTSRAVQELLFARYPALQWASQTRRTLYENLSENCLSISTYNEITHSTGTRSSNAHSLATVLHCLDNDCDPCPENLYIDTSGFCDHNKLLDKIFDTDERLTWRSSGPRTFRPQCNCEQIAIEGNVISYWSRPPEKFFDTVTPSEAVKLLENRQRPVEAQLPPQSLKISVPQGTAAMTQGLLFDRYSNIQWQHTGRDVFDTACFGTQDICFVIDSDGSMLWVSCDGTGVSLADALNRLDGGSPPQYTSSQGHSVVFENERITCPALEIYLTRHEWGQLSKSFKDLRPSIKGKYAGHDFLVKSAPDTLSIDTLTLSTDDVDAIDALVAE